MSEDARSGEHDTPCSSSTDDLNIALHLREWLSQLNVKTLCVEPGSPRENGYIEAFNGKLRDELLDGEIFYTLRQAQVLIERRRRHYNTERPHSSLGYLTPVEFGQQSRRREL